MRPRESSSATAERFLRAYANRKGDVPREQLRREAQYTAWARRRLAQQITDWRATKHLRRVETAAERKQRRAAEAAVFRDVLYDHVGRFARSAIDIRRDLIDDYGSHCERRFWRALNRLILDGLVEKTEDGYRRVSNRRGGGPA